MVWLFAGVEKNSCRLVGFSFPTSPSPARPWHKAGSRSRQYGHEPAASPHIQRAWKLFHHLSFCNVFQGSSCHGLDEL